MAEAFTYALSATLFVAEPAVFVLDFPAFAGVVWNTTSAPGFFKNNAQITRITAMMAPTKKNVFLQPNASISNMAAATLPRSIVLKPKHIIRIPELNPFLSGNQELPTASRVL